MNMKNIPNVVTVLRVVFSAALLFTEPLSLLFFLFYSLCGLSDMLDGFLARKTGSVSTLGSRLDSAADLIFFSATAVLLFPRLGLPAAVWFWIAAIALVRITAAAIARRRFRRWMMLHTFGNKITGFALFCFPFLMPFTEPQIPAWILCGVAGLSALEELAIQIFSKEPDADLPGIFSKKFRHR